MKANEWISSEWKVIHYSQHLHHLHIIYLKLMSWRDRVIVGCLHGLADFSSYIISILLSDILMSGYLQNNKWYATPITYVIFNDILEASELKKLGDCWVSSWSDFSLRNSSRMFDTNQWTSSGRKVVRYSHHLHNLQMIYWNLRSWRNRVIVVWCLPRLADCSLRCHRG